MCTSERCRKGSDKSGSKMRYPWKVRHFPRVGKNFFFFTRTDIESPEMETDKASVEADSQESNFKSGKAT